MNIEIKTFNRGTSEEKARKVCEEAMEFYSEHHYKQFMTCSVFPLMMEIGDLFTVLANYCAENGIDAQECIDLAETKNVIRGYYDA